MLPQYEDLSRFIHFGQLVEHCRVLRRRFPDLGSFFADRQPIVLELGFGNGEYLIRQALARPSDNFLGLELHWGSIRRTLRRLHRQQGSNVRLIQIDAEQAFRYFIEPGSLSELYALFPCPWPKRDHERLRLFSTAFQRLMAGAVRPGGPLRIVTDHAEFRDFILQQSVGSGLSWTLTEVEACYQTKYERRWSGEGQQIFFQLDAQAPAADSQAPGLFWGSASRDGSALVFIKRELFDPRRQEFLFLVVVVEEEGLSNQCFWIQAQYESDSSDWLVSLAPGTGVIPTPGIQQALLHVHQQLQARQALN